MGRGCWVFTGTLLTLMCGEVRERKGRTTITIPLKWKIVWAFCLPKPSEKWVPTG